MSVYVKIVRHIQPNLDCYNVFKVELQAVADETQPPFTRNQGTSLVDPLGALANALFGLHWGFKWSGPA